MGPRVRSIWCSRQTVIQLRDKRRWQLRRPVVVPAGFERVDGAVDETRGGQLEPAVMCSRPSGEGPPVFVHCPYGRRHDWLWVREQYRLEGPRVARRVAYEADALEPSASRWTSALLMPMGAARLWLGIYNVRAQRVQEATGFDISAEGVACPLHDTAYSYCQGECEVRREVFAAYWDARHGATSAAWARNPWVWAVSVLKYAPQLARETYEQERAAAHAEELEGVRALGRVSARARKPSKRRRSA